MPASFAYYHFAGILRGMDIMGKPKLTKTREKGVYSYTDANNKKLYAYRFKYTRTDGKQADMYKQSFKTAKDATLALTRAKADLLSGNYIKHDSADITIKELYDMYMQHLQSNAEQLAPTTIASNFTVYNHIVATIGSMRVKDLTKYTYNQKVLNGWYETLSTGAIKNYHVKFCTMLNFAVDNEIIEKNRLTGIKINVERERGIYTKNEVKTILDYMSTYKRYMYEIVLFLSATGTRAGEALGLKWKDVDFENGVVSINCTRDRYGERATKSKNGVRDIPMTKKLLATLKRYKTEQKAEMLRTGLSSHAEAFEKRYIFVNTQNNPLTYETLSEMFVGMSEVCSFYCKAHKFRHTYASVLISEGVDIATVARLLGDSISTVQDFYVHAVDTKRDEAALKFENAMGDL